MNVAFDSYNCEAYSKLLAEERKVRYMMPDYDALPLYFIKGEWNLCSLKFSYRNEKFKSTLSEEGNLRLFVAKYSG